MQNILRDPQRAAKMRGRADGAHADAWIGHMLVHPAKGKLAVADAACAQSSMAGAAVRTSVPDTDFGKPGRRAIEPSKSAGHAQHDTVHAIAINTATHDDWKSVVASKRHFGAVPRRRPPGATKRHDLADIVQGDAVSAAEAARNGARWAEDAAVAGKRRVPLPAGDSAAGAVALNLGRARFAAARNCKSKRKPGRVGFRLCGVIRDVEAV